MNDRPPDRRPSLRVMVAFAVLAFLVPTVIILGSRDYAPVPPGDAWDYNRHALSIAHGHGFAHATFPVPGKPSAFRPPVYPLLLAGAFAVSGDSWTFGRVVTAAFGVSVVLLVYLIALELWGRRPATLAGLLAAVFPPFIALEVGFFAEPLFLTLELAVVLAVLRFGRDPRGLRWPLAAGVLCGLAALTRTNGLLLVPVAALGIAMLARSRREGTLLASALAAAAIVVISPWTIRNQIAFDRFVPTTTQVGYAAITVFNDLSRANQAEVALEPPELLRTAADRTLTEADVDARLRSRAISYVESHPGYALKAVTLNTLRTLRLWRGRFTGFLSYRVDGVRWSRPYRDLTRLSIYPVYGLVLIGCGGLALSRRWRRPPLFFWLVPLLLVAVSGVAGGADRWRAPADPFFLMLAGLALTLLADLGRSRWLTRRAGSGAST
jgi:4-amino-4-deoxy-L-arabinose transferase-like glycosyltransferase